MYAETHCKDSKNILVDCIYPGQGSQRGRNLVESHVANDDDKMLGSLLELYEEGRISKEWIETEIRRHESIAEELEK